MVPVKHGQAIGVIVVDKNQTPLYFNWNAAKILAYPQEPSSAEPTGVLLSKLLSTIAIPANEALVVLTFYSGRRRYICRLIPAERADHKGVGAIVISLERLQGPA